MTSRQSDADFLKQNEQFLGMPEKIRGWIGESEHVTNDFAGFFRNGGKIQTRVGIELPYYESIEPPRIMEAWLKAQKKDLVGLALANHCHGTDFVGAGANGGGPRPTLRGPQYQQRNQIWLSYPLPAKEKQKNG